MTTTTLTPMPVGTTIRYSGTTNGINLQKPKTMTKKKFDLDQPLLSFAGEEPATTLTVGTATTGLLIVGATGSGKSAFSGATIARRMIRYGYGGIVLCVKKGEADLFRKYCKEAGREDDLMVVKPLGEHRFNFLSYMAGERTETSYAQNLVDLLKNVLAASKQRSQGGENEGFWQNSLEMFLYNLVTLCLTAYDGKITIQLLYDVAQSAPKKTEDGAGKDARQRKSELVEPTAFDTALDLTKKKLREKVEAWRASKPPIYFEGMFDADYLEEMYDAVPEMRSIVMMHKFFKEDLYNLSSRTRGILDVYVLGTLFRFLQEPIYSLFSSSKPSTFSPESSLDGRIIVFDIPVKVHEAAAIDAQLLIKTVFQKAWERRNIEENNRPVFIWADEAQFFLGPYDNLFQSTARASLITTVYLTQSLPGFYVAMGAGDSKSSEHQVDAFLSNMTTKLFHANNEVKSNEWASALIGSAYTADHSETMNYGEKFSFTTGKGYSLERMVRPEAFSRLLMGNKASGHISECYIHMQGVTFRNGSNHRKIQFTLHP